MQRGEGGLPKGLGTQSSVSAKDTMHLITRLRLGTTSVRHTIQNVQGQLTTRSWLWNMQPPAQHRHPYPPRKAHRRHCPHPRVHHSPLRRLLHFLHHKAHRLRCLLREARHSHHRSPHRFHRVKARVRHYHHRGARPSHQVSHRVRRYPPRVPRLFLPHRAPQRRFLRARHRRSHHP